MAPLRFTEAEFVPDAGIFGSRMKDVRNSLGVTQRELAQHARLPESSVAAYEAGHRNPSLPALVRLAVACGVEPSSAVFHARLRADSIAMRRAHSDALLASAAVTPALAALGAAVPAAGLALVGLSAGRLARTVRRARYESYTRPTEQNEYKLFEAAVSAEPVQSAIEAGIYPLEARPSRKELEKGLADAAKKLSEEELYGLVAALNARPEEGSHAESP